VGFTANADVWCPACAETIYPGLTVDGQSATDDEGNEIYPIFVGDEGWADDRCARCGELLENLL
jgi:hypothetical protein